MLAVRLHAAGEALRVEELPLPEPRGTEVRVRVAACGVCHTDLHIVDGTQRRVELPVTLGHEIAGWIEAVGPDAARLVAEQGLVHGDAVAVHGGWGCGACSDCVAGDEQRCGSSLAPGFQRDGGYAEAVLVPHPRHLLALNGLDPIRAAPLTDAGVTPYRAVRRATPWLVPGARVLILGAGALGRFALQYLRALPTGQDLRIVVVERDPRRLPRALDLGADAAVLDSASDGTAELGRPAQAVFDFVGSDATLSRGLGAVAPGGVFVLVGEGSGRHPFSFDHVPVESWLTTVAWGSRAELIEVLEMARGGRLRWEAEAVPLAEAAAAHDRLRAGEVVDRLVLVPPGQPPKSREKSPFDSERRT